MRNMHEAKTNLSRIAEDVASGEEIIVAKAGKPKMKLVPIDNNKKKIRFGALKGKIKISDDVLSRVLDESEWESEADAGYGRHPNY